MCDNENIKEEELKIVENCLNNIGVSCFDNNGNYRPAYEVIRDIAYAFKQMRETSNEEAYRIQKEYTLLTLLGVRLKNEFRC